MLIGKCVMCECLKCVGKLRQKFFCSAAAYSQQGDHEKAVQDAQKAIEIDPKYSKAYSRMG